MPKIAVDELMTRDRVMRGRSSWLALVLIAAGVGVLSAQDLPDDSAATALSFRQFVDGEEQEWPIHPPEVGQMSTEQGNAATSGDFLAEAIDELLAWHQDDGYYKQ